jgi:hypothetical protein
MAAHADRDEMLQSVRRKQARLAPEVGYDVRVCGAAHLARESIAIERGGLGSSCSRPVVQVEPHVECHAQRRQQDGAPSGADQQKGRQDGRVVEPARCRLFLRLRTVEGADGRHRIQAAISYHEP